MGKSQKVQYSKSHEIIIDGKKYAHIGIGSRANLATLTEKLPNGLCSECPNDKSCNGSLLNPTRVCMIGKHVLSLETARSIVAKSLVDRIMIMFKAKYFKFGYTVNQL
jgi:hypothetical protein